MKIGDHVRRISGESFIGVITQVFHRDVDKQGVKCEPYTMFRVEDGKGGVRLGRENEFQILGS